MKEEISLDIEMSKEEMAKIKELLTSSPGLRHYAFQLKNGEYLDLVEYKDYEKLEEKNKSLQSQLKAKEEAEKEFIKLLEYKWNESQDIWFIKLLNKYKEITSKQAKENDEILSKGENK